MHNEDGEEQQDQDVKNESIEKLQQRNMYVWLKHQPHTRFKSQLIWIPYAMYGRIMAPN